MNTVLSRSSASTPRIIDAVTYSPDNRRRLSRPGLLAFVAISDLWDLSEKQRLLLLGLPSRSTYHGWLRAAHAGVDITLPLDILLRISGVLGIHKALRILFQSRDDGIAWLRGPHAAPVFAGRPPLALLTDGTQDSILAVRRFLDAARGGAYMAPNATDLDFTPYTDQDLVFV